MPTASFRIEKVTVEGFKAFAATQILEIGDGHLFVFGENGRGKSSVLEAIRWCLFGLADRPDAEVRNVFYEAGDCRVELDLRGPGGKWKMQRRLRPGSGKSDVAVQDPDGVVVPLARIFPHIARLGPREGTHIIFASQQSTNRRPQADINDFDKVLYSFLRVEAVPDLLNRFERVLEEQAQVERQLAEDITKVEESLRAELEALQRVIDEILSSAPWPAGGVPTNAETDARIRRFVEECGGAVSRADGGAVTRDWLLGEAERAIKHTTVGTKTQLQGDLDLARGQRQQVIEAWEAHSEVDEQVVSRCARVAACEAGLADATRDASREQLQVERDQMLKRNTELAMHLSLIQQASVYYEDVAPNQCPICGAPTMPAEVLSRLSSVIGSKAGAAELAAALADVSTRLAAIVETENALARQRSDVQDLESRRDAASARLNGLLDDPEDSGSYQRTVDRIGLRIGEIEGELASAGGLTNARNAQLKNLRAEVRFQEHRSREERLLQTLDGGLGPTREAHGAFLDLIDTLSSIKDALQDAFNSTLNTTLPKIGELMTDVFGRLTQQASFTRIGVQPGPSTAERTLRVLVTSERTPGVFFEPSEVLNGQAFSALNLVPYFVFSQFQAEALELDCLLIDDPSQSFDTSRIEILLRELATAATHAQLIVASHEEERFKPFINSCFTAGSYRVLRVTGFTPEAGPTLEWSL